MAHRSIPMNTLIKNSFVFVCVASLLLACSIPDRVGDTKELVQEMKDNQIKRVTGGQLTEIVDNWGKRIVRDSERELVQNLAKKPGQTATVCQLKNLPITDSLRELYAVEIRLFGAKDLKNPAISAKEQEILGAFMYNVQNNIPPVDNIQRLGDTAYVYNAAIETSSLVCQKCFDIKPVAFAVWSVVFSKREVIRRVDAKSLRKKVRK